MNRNDLYLNSSRRALVVGSSGSIGHALVHSLRKRIGSNNVVSISRIDNGMDLMKPESIAIEASKQSGKFDLILDATGALEINGIGPEKSFQSLDYRNMVNQFKVNAIGPALILKHFMRFLPRSGKSVFVTLSARVGSIEDNKLGGWISYRSSKSALNQIVKTAAIELTRKNPDSVCICLHPGTVRSKLTENYLGKHRFVEPEVAASNIIRVIEEKGSSDSGGFFDYNGNVIPW